LTVKSTAGAVDTHHMTTPPRSPLISRRRMLRGAVACAVCTGAAGASRLFPAQAASGTASTLEGPGSALMPAERLALRVPEGKLMFPVDAASDCYILDNFGADRGGRLHEGVDIMGSAGNAVFAVADGTLTKRYTNTSTAGWGWTLYDERTAITYKYFHLTEDPNGRTLGGRVRIGDVIGFVGASGTSSATNFHLHFEVRPNNVPVDPLPLLFVDPTGCGVSAKIR
jgi:murein DD-endopeptidase MepM/ murein hydrolase activator NlpD